MNKFAYQTTGYAIKALSNLSKAKVRIHGENNIPKGAVIYAVNHFTRMETLFIPYHINRLTKHPIWSLADYGLFEGGLGNLLGKLGALSTKNPDRDLLIVKSLLTGEASWVIFLKEEWSRTKKFTKKIVKARGRL
jgi:1-acyl-sn-glycerol-3-phosphate acyltransferase